MLIVDPAGLFEGERLATCSDLGQLHWQRLFIAANGHARLELSYSAICNRVYKNFKKPPSEDELWGLFEEYARAFLVILYQSHGVWWCQFATSKKYMPRYTTARDDASPPPPIELVNRHREGYTEWKRAKSLAHQRFRKFAESSGNVPKVSDAVAVAVAVVDDIAIAVDKAKNKSPGLFVLPDWIPRELWAEFEEMRRKLRKPMTDKARDLIVRDLEKLRGEGYEVVQVIEKSIANSWQGVFPLREEKYYAASNNGIAPAVARKHASDDAVDQAIQRLSVTADWGADEAGARQLPKPGIDGGDGGYVDGSLAGPSREIFT